MDSTANGYARFSNETVKGAVMRLSKLVPIIGVAGAVTGGTLAAPRLMTDLLWRRKSRSRRP